MFAQNRTDTVRSNSFCLAATFALFLCVAPLHACSALADKTTQNTQSVRIGVGGVVSPGPLVAHRHEYSTDNPIIKNIFDNYQLYKSLELTTFYDSDGAARPAYRIRWFSNTHIHTDEAIVDAADFSLLRQTSLGADYKSSSTKNIIYMPEKIVAVTTHGDQKPKIVEMPIEDKTKFYHLIVLPYLLASIDVAPGVRFQLPAFNSGKGDITSIEIKYRGKEQMELAGEQRIVHKYTSDHGWVSIDWFIDKRSPPYFVGGAWHYSTGRFAGTTSPQTTIDWVVFENDTNIRVVRENPGDM